MRRTKWLCGILGVILLSLYFASSPSIVTAQQGIEQRIETLEQQVEDLSKRLIHLEESIKRILAPKSTSREVAKQGETDYEAEIKAYARKKWPDDYEMQAYEFENQMNALGQIRNLPSTADYNQSILLKAMAQWGEDYEMVIYEYNNQLEAYKKMR